ncbi:MAG: hypothetical protein Q9208_007178 [Pyrenodesmia sp. 3 TL-2023]
MIVYYYSHHAKNLQGTWYIMQLPSEAFDSAKIANLRRILHHIDQRGQAIRENAGCPSPAADIPGEHDHQTGRGNGQNLPEAAAGSEKRSRSVQVITIDDDDDTTPGAPESAVTASKKRPGRPRNAVDGPSTPSSAHNESWGAITATDALQLPDLIREHLAANTTHDAAEFLLGSTPLPGTGNPGMEGLPQLCRDVHKMPRKETMHRVGRLFLKLLLGDIASRFGPNTSTLRKAIVSSHGEETRDDIQPTLKGGRNLVRLCKWFGTGCVFWLSDQFTDTFLANRVTTSGPFYEKGMKHIEHLGLLRLIEASSANKLGDAIRAHLARVYAVEQFGSDAMEKASEEADSDEKESHDAWGSGM